MATALEMPNIAFFKSPSNIASPHHHITTHPPFHRFNTTTKKPLTAKLQGLFKNASTAITFNEL
jgi:hypothetical protein